MEGGRKERKKERSEGGGKKGGFYGRGKRRKMNLPSTLTPTESTAGAIKTVGKALANSVAART
jgi:hypothetical protein